MLHRRSTAVAAALSLYCAQLFGDVRFVKWDKPAGTGNQGNVAALDTSSGKVLWERKLAKEANFVTETTAGILVGTDDSVVHLLNKADGQITWSRAVGKAVTSFHGESADGFLVSHGDEFYWLVDHSGTLKFKW